MRLRPATPEDAGPLATILGDWIRETGWMPVLHSRKEDEGFLRHLIGTAEVTLAEEGGPLGFVARDGDVVRALYLSPTARGSGIGRALLDHARSGRARLMLWTFAKNERAVAFYAREGFRVERRGDGSGNEENLPDILMRWERDER